MVTEQKKSSTKADGFFSADSFYVEEKRSSVSGGNRSLVYDGTGLPAGSIIQRSNFAARFWRIFLKASLLPFRVELHDASGQPITAIRRGWTILRSRTEIVDGQERVIGYLKHKESSRKPRIKVYNGEGKKIGEVTGNRGSWDMIIIDREYLRLGEIGEHAPESTPGQTRGKDTYFVHLAQGQAPESDRRLLLTASIAIDRLMEHN